MLPLLFPLAGVARLRHRGLIWGAFLAIVYFIIGATEAWSNPDQRMAACVQIILVVGYLAGVIALSRRPGPPVG